MSFWSLAWLVTGSEGVASLKYCLRIFAYCFRTLALWTRSFLIFCTVGITACQHMTGNKGALTKQKFAHLGGDKYRLGGRQVPQ